MRKLYSLEKVHELADGDESFIQILVETFLEEIPSDLGNMSKAVADNNSKIAYQFAHKMKPNFMLFGIDVADKVRLLESWSEGEITHEEAKPILVFIKETAEGAIAQLHKDFKQNK